MNTPRTPGMLLALRHLCHWLGNRAARRTHTYRYDPAAFDVAAARRLAPADLRSHLRRAELAGTLRHTARPAQATRVHGLDAVLRQVQAALTRLTPH